jgi:hypothetical protein
MRIPGLDWLDKPFAAVAGPTIAKPFNTYVGPTVAKPLNATASFVGSTVKKSLKVAGKGALIVGGLAAGAYALSSIVGSFRDNRQSPEPEQKPITPLDPYTEMGLIPPQMEMAASGQETLMGQPLVEGTHAQRYLSGRSGGRATGMAVSPEAPDVDGRPVQDLGSIGMAR